MRNSEVVEDQLHLQFVALLLHDMETPLAVTRQFLNRVKEGKHDPKNPRHLSVLESTELAVERASRILEDLLDQARHAGSGITATCRPTDLKDVLRRCVRLVGPLAEDRGIRLYEETDESLESDISCDERLIERVIDNLLVNAIRHAPAGSYVVTRLSGREDCIRIEVINPNGEEGKIQLDRIFEPERQVELRRLRSYHGTGLGLTFSKLTIEAHHGRIGADMDEDNQVRFWFELPRN